MTGRPSGDEVFLPGLRGPWIALDIGDVRIGVAVSDPEGVLARPLDTVARIPKKECLNRLEKLAHETGAQGAVIGLPLLESGQEGQQAERTRAFVRSLVRRIPGLRVAWWDERHTTAEAKDFLRERGEPVDGGTGHGRVSGQAKDAGSGRTRSRRDEIAATLLLQEWLDERRRRQSRHSG